MSRPLVTIERLKARIARHHARETRYTNLARRSAARKLALQERLMLMLDKQIAATQSRMQECAIVAVKRVEEAYES